MVDKTDIFWTDAQQAQERLTSTIILYDDRPVYVTDIVTRDREDVEAPHIPRANIFSVEDRKRVTSRKRLDSPKFKRFRELPKLGWVNNPKTGLACYLSRRPVQGSRSHGISEGCLRGVSTFLDDNNNITLSRLGAVAWQDCVFTQAFVNMHQGVYPSLEEVLLNIQENTAVAYSRDFCVVQDRDGIRWLYYKTTKAGIFTGSNTLSLLRNKAYLREMIMDDPAFTLDTITEF